MRSLTIHLINKFDCILINQIKFFLKRCSNQKNPPEKAGSLHEKIPMPRNGDEDFPSSFLSFLFLYLFSTSLPETNLRIPRSSPKRITRQIASTIHAFLTVPAMQYPTKDTDADTATYGIWVVT